MRELSIEFLYLRTAVRMPAILQIAFEKRIVGIIYVA
jgi:hypothetical protein